MNTRQAEPEDARALEDLYKVLVPGDPNIHVDPRRLAELHTDPRHYLLVVEADGVVCGTAFLSLVLDAMYGGQPFGIVENVVISPAHQGKGLGGFLMSAIEEKARDAKCTKLMLLSSVARTRAHRFFAAIGFEGEKKRGFIKYLNRSASLPVATK